MKVRIIRQHWIKDDGVDDPDDKCSHGYFKLLVGGEVIEECGDATLSATGLFLMRALERDWRIGKEENLLFPCCGYFLIPAADAVGREVEIMGCPSGTDLNIEHRAGNVVITAASGATETMSEAAFRDLVMAFVDEVAAFYGPPERKVHYDAWERQGVEDFWEEWGRRRGALVVR